VSIKIKGKTVEKGVIMAYKISDACISCGQCSPSCPVEAIAEGTPYVIDAEKCTDCGACEATCPVQAISQA